MRTRRQFIRNGLTGGALGWAMLLDDSLARVRAAVQSQAGFSALQSAGDEDFWMQIQQAYAVDRSMINLNNGGVSPSPRVVQEAQRRHMEFANESPARHLWSVQDPQVENVRARLARAWGALPEEMAITRNSSEALEICIHGMDLKAGDEVVATELDYPRMLTTYRQREVRDGIKLRLASVKTPVQSEEEIVELYQRQMTDRTRVLLVSHVVFVTGQIMPVRRIVELGKQRGAAVIVDGAHAFAHLAVKRDDLNCDYYGVSLHKWLTAPHGTGFLYVRRERVEALWPLMAAVEPRSGDIRKFEEIGTHPAASRLAIAEALVLYNAIGPRRKEARLRYLRDRWARRLLADKRVRLATRIEPEHGCAFATMSIDGTDPLKLVEHLWNKHKIIVVAIDYGGVKGVRVSPNTYTTLDEIDTFSSAIEDVLANGLPT